MSKSILLLMPTDEATQKRRNEAFAAAKDAFKRWLAEEIRKSEAKGIKVEAWAESVGTTQPTANRWGTGMAPEMKSLVLLSLATGDSISKMLGQDDSLLRGMDLVAAVMSESPKIQQKIWQLLDDRFGPMRNAELAETGPRTAPTTPAPPPPSVPGAEHRGKMSHRRRRKG